jgi:hypothetical protein
MNEQELMALRQRAMRAAEAYGCHAGIEVADFLDPPGSLHYLKIVVARCSASHVAARSLSPLPVSGDRPQ